MNPKEVMEIDSLEYNENTVTKILYMKIYWLCMYTCYKH